MTESSEIKNIIFDFGGVVININYELTRQAIEKAGINNFNEIYTQFQQDHLFDEFETGRLDSDTFFERIYKLAGGKADMQTLHDAWNAMLLDFPTENFNLLHKVKSNYRTFLLSNTNEAHLSYYSGRLKSWYGIDNMDSLFEKTYYSCRMGMRKPEVEIFQQLVNENHLDKQVTLFIDDSPQHVEGAGRAGLNALHLSNGAKLTDLFNEEGKLK